MSKKNILITICVLLVIAAVGDYLIKKIPAKTNPSETRQAEFRKTLKGEIVFVRRDGLYLNIYKINADGTGEKMIYHHENKLNSNASHPEWSEDGSKIYFSAMEGVDWENIKSRKFMIDVDGSNAQLLPKGTEFRLGITSQRSREKDIIVKLGSLYYINEAGKEISLYYHKNFDPDLNPGVWDASWSPDKKYIIFYLDDYITIISKDGAKTAKIAKGAEPDWKY